MSDKDDEKTDAEEMLEAHQELEENIAANRTRLIKACAVVMFIVLLLVSIFMLSALLQPVSRGFPKIEF